jgi:hypothetical protein
MEEGSFDWYSVSSPLCQMVFIIVGSESTLGPAALKDCLLNDIFQRIVALLWTTCAAPRYHLKLILNRS